ncbi:leucine-rich repeats and immunoglobulin-like domains protein 3 [Leptopilina boulardi]|uniref:leucine-rich repeats and immunoglobulin-like domains protein 3 n=1 Tax=Leptopilina boulardi TaxID=63433 RepID=UPI0021F66C11|nr:leucine-rich repeats and immunoglobulin-like domains protein 3 [Leptopilina boulardi]
MMSNLQKASFVRLWLSLLWMTCFASNIGILGSLALSQNQCPVECACLGNVVACSELQLVEAPSGLPPWTVTLELNSNNISNLEFNVLLHLLKLKELDVSANQLRDNFTISLPVETQLRVLKLNKNHLTQLPQFLFLSSLTHLSLSHNLITKINGSTLLNLPGLQYLDLTGNKISIIHYGSFLAPNQLKTLNLNMNQLSIIENKSLENLTSLEELRLNKNRLIQIKDQFTNLLKLRILELNRNDLRQIEALSLKDLKGLEELSLKRNKLESLYDGAFWPLKNLRLLQLDFNLLTSVKKGSLFGLDNLEKLTLSHNKITKIEAQAWEFCKKLLELDLSFNELTSIERGTFEYLGRLEKLKIDQNKLSYISEGAFNNTQSLQVLELNSNKISYMVEDFSGAFVPLTQLMKLGLAHNQIKSINKNAFKGLSQVTEIDLLGNNITSIQENAFSPTPNLIKLKMNTGSLVCDCGLQWLSLWLKTHRQSEAKIHCGYPHWLYGMPLMHLHQANFTCEDYPKPLIIQNPESQMSIKGDNVSLICRATSTADAPLHFTWKHDNVEWDPSFHKDVVSSNRGLTEASSTLQITNITHSNSGRYQCMVTNNYGTTYSAKAKISVLIYPSFSKIPQDKRVNAGSTARLECSAEGLPAPQIAWQKDGGNDFPAARERRMHKMPADDVLFIIDVKTADSGVYSCIAQNLAGMIIVNATLTILEGPSFVKPMENKEIMAGGSIVLDCRASGSPRPKILWRKNNSPLQATERHFFTAEDQLLIIVNTIASDAGDYECEISNTLGSIVGASHLKINPAPSSMVNEDDMLGLIIITVVCCAVGTSIVWVVIIYQTRQRLKASHRQSLSTSAPIVPETQTHLYLDTSSQHSKDSGTGDSTNPSNDQLQLCLPEELMNCATNNEEDVEAANGENPLLRYTNHERHIIQQESGN